MSTFSFSVLAVIPIHQVAALAERQPTWPLVVADAEIPLQSPTTSTDPTEYHDLTEHKRVIPYALV